MRGSAVDLKRACCDVEGGWTWSNVKLCFFVGPAEEVGTCAPPFADAAFGADDVEST